MSDYAGNKMEYSEGGGVQVGAKAGINQPSVLDVLKKTKEKTGIEKDIAADQAEIAASQQKIAEANKAVLAAQFPAGTTKPLEGTITTDDKFGYLAELIAYKALSKKLEEIAIRIKKFLPANSKILVVDTMDVAAGYAELLQIQGQLEFYLKSIPEETKKTENLLKPPSDDRKVPEIMGWGVGLGSLATIVPGLVSAVADVVGYFQPNYDIKSRVVTPQNTSLQAMLVGHLVEGSSVFFPNLHIISSSPIVNTLKACLENRINLSLADATLKTTKISVVLAERKKLEEAIAALDGEIKKLKSPDDDTKIDEKKKELQAKKDELAGKAATVEEQQVARNEALIAAFDTFHAAITTTPTGKTYSPLAAAAMQEYYKEGDITHLLHLSATSTGGEAIIERSILWSKKISYTGGGVITCIVAECTGKVIFAASETAYAKAIYNLRQAKLQEEVFL